MDVEEEISHVMVRVIRDLDSYRKSLEIRYMRITPPSNEQVPETTASKSGGYACCHMRVSKTRYGRLITAESRPRRKLYVRL
jgi:hypothetical protein